ncbi:MAG: hypothetical protein JNM89_02210 [Hyphomicrobiaceae bacterium]|nr:hypothetical protein [Hyphomicrobiaceae bacterium]
MRDTAHRDQAIKRIVDQALDAGSAVEALRVIARDFHSIYTDRASPRVIISNVEIVCRLAEFLPEPTDVVAPEAVRYGPSQRRFVDKRAPRICQDGSLSKAKPS